MDVFWAAVLETISLHSLPRNSPASACARMLGLPRKEGSLDTSEALFLARVGAHILESDLACESTCAALAEFLRAQRRKT
jgi:hypothetical protein